MGSNVRYTIHSLTPVRTACALLGWPAVSAPTNSYRTRDVQRGTWLPVTSRTGWTVARLASCRRGAAHLACPLPVRDYFCPRSQG